MPSYCWLSDWRRLCLKGARPRETLHPQNPCPEPEKGRRCGFPTPRGEGEGAKDEPPRRKGPRESDRKDRGATFDSGRLSLFGITFLPVVGFMAGHWARAKGRKIEHLFKK